MTGPGMSDRLYHALVYLLTVALDGDWQNDWLTHIYYEPWREALSLIGEAFANYLGY